jgi:hypothetical protein
MARFLLYAIPVVFILYCLIDALQSRRATVRMLPKWLWLVVIMLIPVLGAAAWLIWGRPPRVLYAAPSSGTSPGLLSAFRSRGPAAPDDDPAFLRQLDDEAWSRKMRERREGTEPGDDPAAH